MKFTSLALGMFFAQPFAFAFVAKAACPASLTGSWQAPSLITVVDQQNPNAPGHSSTNGTVIAGKLLSLYDYDIPQSYLNSLCALEFLFPKNDPTKPPRYTFSGSGIIEFGLLYYPSNASTPYNGDYAFSLGNTTIAPGNAYTPYHFPCPAGAKIGFAIRGYDFTKLNYVQDSTPCPLGLYVQKLDNLTIPREA